MALVIGYANYRNSCLENWETSLRKHGYNYIILGENQVWKGFRTRIKATYQYLRCLDRNQIVVITDTYDVLACRPQEELLNAYLENYNSKLVVSAELPCGRNCRPLNNWWSLHSGPRSPFQYANVGFYMGPVILARKFFREILRTKISDDQLAAIEVIESDPSLIELDIDHHLCSPITGYDHFYYKWDHGIINTITKKKPAFVHIPGMYTDLFVRYNYFGSKILGTEWIQPSIKDHRRPLIYLLLSFGLITLTFGIPALRIPVLIIAVVGLIVYSRLFY